MKNQVIWKFPFVTTDTQVIQMPAEAKVLKVAYQYDKPCIWAIVDAASEMVDVTIDVFGTGHPINSIEREYLGSYIQANSFVFHVFKRL